MIFDQVKDDIPMEPTIISPMTGNEMVLRSEPRRLTIRGLEIEIMYSFFRDTDGVQYTETGTDTLNFEQIYEQLWTRYGVARPDESSGEAGR